MKRIVTFAGFGGGGSAVALLSLLKNVNRGGYKVLVLIPRKSEFTDQLERLGVDYALMGEKPTSRLGQLFWLLRLFNIVRRFKPDLIHSNISVEMYGYIISRILRVPHVWHLREYGEGVGGCNLYRLFPPAKMKRILRSKSYSISVAKGLTDFWELGGCDLNRVIYDGVRFLDNQPAGGRRCDDFLFVGTVEPLKGVEDMIPAFVKYAEAGGTGNLVIVGPDSPDYRSYLLSLTQGTAAEGRVNFEGHRNNVHDYMLRHRYLIVPSNFEPFGLVLAEGMSDGCLPIIRDVAGIKEQLDNARELCGEEVGLRFTTVDQLAARMAEAKALSAEQIDRMTTLGSNAVRTLYPEKKSTDLTFRFFDDILAATR